MGKTNFKQIINPDFLGAYSLDDGNNGYVERDGFILSVNKQKVADMSGTSEKLVAQTSIGKPMILKATNSKVIQAITGSKYIEDWRQVPVTFYVELNVKSPQGLVDALRLKRQKNAPKKDYTPMKNKIESCKTLEELQSVFTALLPDEKTACFDLKDSMKKKLTPKEQ